MNAFTNDEVAAAATPTRAALASCGLMAGAVLIVLLFKMLAALLAGTMAFVLVQKLSARMRTRMAPGLAQKLAALTITMAVIGVMFAVGFYIFRFFLSGGLNGLLNQILDVMSDNRLLFPAEVAQHLPASVDALRLELVAFIKSHSAEVRSIGCHTLSNVLHILIGTIIGAIASFSAAAHKAETRGLRPLPEALLTRMSIYVGAFEKFVFAQLKISSINTLSTAAYLLLILPLFDVHLPHAKTLVAVTFVAGLLPIVGNLISNTIITIVSLGISLPVAFASLAFLVLLHKLEYTWESIILGGAAQAKVWEILAIMLVMESMFGVAGLAFAPVFYTYLKDELRFNHVL